MKTFIALALACTLFVVALVGSGLAEQVNAETHCHADGAPCWTTCEHVEPASLQEDDPCWFIVSPSSNYEIPMLAKLFGARDYR